ncbi:GHKL domain-containing protein [Butyricicoccus faecihominis]|uniref:sensor histidine kinase n=1 Tax=Butyricicoccus faecihominis TaxID=1712515 RepID=UPI002479D790|nr:GHKL domain-containing protein [Butyricicoccus faecihominis]MCQ5128978.1 GHKL domain-containing protein [Butyricicoccus faecihominis]
MSPSAMAALIPDSAFGYFLENISSSLSCVLLFAGMLTLNDDWKPGRKGMWGLLVIAILLLQPILYVSHYMVLFKLLFCIFSMLGMATCYRRRTPAFWFSVCVMCTVACFCSTLSGLLLLLYPDESRLVFKLPLTVLSYLLVRRFFKPLMLQLKQSDSTYWGHLYAVPLSMFAALMFVTLALSDYTHGGRRFPVFFSVSLLAFAFTVYSILHYLFRSVYLRQQQTHDNDVLRTQMAAVVRRADEIIRQDEAERVFRHDLRHHVNALSTCIDAGAYEEARALLQRTQQTLNGLEQTRQTITRYTGRPVLDAVLSSYGDALEQCDARYQVALRLPETLEPDLAELSTVLSNALENALHACLALPKGRERAVKVLGETHGAQFLLTVSNTCPFDTLLDPLTSLPRATRPGHGYGTRSIAIFAARWGGVLDYQVADGWFHMHLLI